MRVHTADYERILCPRRAYTLLEVLLATAIGVLLMGALYVAVDVQVRHTQEARDIVEQSTLARSLLARIGNDISCHLGPVNPNASSGAGSQAAGGGGAAAGSTPTTGTTTPASGAATTAASSQNSTTSTAPTTSNSAVPFNLGVQGDTGRLTLYVSRVSREAQALTQAVGGLDVPPVPSDLQRITYWLAGASGDNPLGLARQEIKWATSPDLDDMPPDIPDDPSQIIAEEVKTLQFSYFDGTSWQDTWDGTALGSDGKTPLGPPPAIAVVIGVQAPASRYGASPVVKTYRHVVAILPANGTTQQTSSTTTP